MFWDFSFFWLSATLNLSCDRLRQRVYELAQVMCVAVRCSVLNIVSVIGLFCTETIYRQRVYGWVQVMCQCGGG